MLALTRKAGQSIIIGDQIEITVVEVKADQIRLGIKAPKEISIYRKELYDEIMAENKAAAHCAQLQVDGLEQLEAEVIKIKKLK